MDTNTQGAATPSSQTSPSTGSTQQTNTPAAPSTGPKHNPWADETVRNTAQGAERVKPITQPTTPPATPASGAVTPDALKTPPVTVTPSTPATQTPPVAQTPPPQTGQSLDTKALAKEFATELRALQTPAAAPQATVSDEEFDRTFGVVKLTDQDFAAIIGFAPERPEQVAALNNTLQRLNQQSVKMANYMAQQQIKDLEARLSGQMQPIMQQTAQRVEAELQNQFFTQYPAFKDHMPLLQEIKEGVLARKQTFNSPEELINFVATRAATLLGRPVESFKTAAAVASNGGQTQQQQTTAASRQMTTTSVGGRVGSSQAATTKPKSTAEALFGDD